MTSYKHSTLALIAAVSSQYILPKQYLVTQKRIKGVPCNRGKLVHHNYKVIPTRMFKNSGVKPTFANVL